MKVTKTKSHDKMALRVSDGKSWTKLTISRSGWKISGRGSEIKDVALKIKGLIEEVLDAGFNYGDAIDYIEADILSEAAKINGQKTSEAKASASRENGKKGGRPCKQNDLK